jgi:hypothetical protein
VQKLALHKRGESPRLQFFTGPVASVPSECSQDYQPNSEYKRATCMFSCQTGKNRFDAHRLGIARCGSLSAVFGGEHQPAFDGDPPQPAEWQHIEIRSTPSKKSPEKQGCSPRRPCALPVNSRTRLRKISPSEGFAQAFGENTSPFDLHETERRLIAQALAATNGNVTAAAKKLGISRRTLHRKMVFGFMVWDSAPFALHTAMKK